MDPSSEKKISQPGGSTDKPFSRRKTMFVEHPKKDGKKKQGSLMAALAKTIETTIDSRVEENCMEREMEG